MLFKYISNTQNQTCSPAHFSHAINCALSLSRKRTSRTNACTSRRHTHWTTRSSARSRSIHAATHKRTHADTTLRVCVLPWLRCCCCCRWFLLEGASCKAKLVACGCERSAPSSSVRHLPRNLRKNVTRNSRATQSAACHTVPNKVFSACSKRSLTQLKSNWN